MGSALNIHRSQQPSAWQFFYRPMLVFSLLLHSLVLLLPLPSQPEVTPEEEEAEIQIMELAPLSETPPTPGPTPEATPTPKPQPVPTPVVAAPVPVPRSQPNLVPNPSPAPPPTETPDASEALPDLEAEVTAQETTETAISVDDQEFQDFLGEFQSGLEGLGAAEAANVGIPYYNFPQPDAFFTAESIAAADRGSGDPELQPGAVTFIWASRRRPGEVFDALQARFAGFELTPMTEYGGGELYEVKKGDTIRYISLVRAKDRTATFVVIWSRDPNAPTDESGATDSPIS